MTEHKKITCDACERDLTYTGNCVEYRLALNVESIPANSGFVTLMHLSPDIDGSKHFCGLRCLKKWASKDD